MPRLLIALLLLTSIGPVHAKKVCKVSMMGRVCFEEGAELATSSHMKGDAVKETKIAKTVKEKSKLAGTQSAK